jgi:hypothetical protein
VSSPIRGVAAGAVTVSGILSVPNVVSRGRQVPSILVASVRPSRTIVHPVRDRLCVRRVTGPEGLGLVQEVSDPPLDLVGDVRVRDRTRTDRLVEVAGGVAEPQVPDALADGLVRVGEGHIEVRLLVDLPVVVHPGDQGALLRREGLDARRRDVLAVAVQRDVDDRVLEVVLAETLPDPVEALLGREFEVDKDELAGLEAPPGDVSVAVELDEVVAAVLALARARALGGPTVRDPRPGDLLGRRRVFVAEQHGVEVDGRAVEDLLGVPLDVAVVGHQRCEEAVGDERRVVGVVGVELVLEVVPLGARDEVKPVEGGVVDDDRRVPEARRQPHGLEEVEPLRVAFRLVVADDGEEGDIRLVEGLEDVDGPQQIRQARAAVVEEVAGVDDGVDVEVDRVVGDPSERRQKVRPALRPVVLSVSQVGVAGVKHPRHSLGASVPPLISVSRPRRKCSVGDSPRAAARNCRNADSARSPRRRTSGSAVDSIACCRSARPPSSTNATAASRSSTAAAARSTTVSGDGPAMRASVAFTRSDSSTPGYSSSSPSTLSKTKPPGPDSPSPSISESVVFRGRVAGLPGLPSPVRWPRPLDGVHRFTSESSSGTRNAGPGLPPKPFVKSSPVGLRSFRPAQPSIDSAYTRLRASVKENRESTASTSSRRVSA